MDRTAKLDVLMQEALAKVVGIEGVHPVGETDRPPILAVEEEAEKQSLMGLGKVINTGVREVLRCNLVYAALTTMDFDWGCAASLVLKKGDEVVGEEVRDESRIQALSGQKNVWFMHRNFVIYKDKINFPQDIMKKICYFEIPGLPADWCTLDAKDLEPVAVCYSNPSTRCDIYLKEQFFDDKDQKGFGTILVGADFTV